MSDDWFTEYALREVAVPKSMLPAEYQKALEEPATMLPAWDPMGALLLAREACVGGPRSRKQKTVQWTVFSASASRPELKGESVIVGLGEREHKQLL